MPNPSVATSLDVIPPLATMNRGRTSRFDTTDTSARDTALPMDRLSAGEDPVTSVRLVYNTAFFPEAIAFWTRSSMASDVDDASPSRVPAVSPTRSATSNSIVSNPSNLRSDSSCFVVLGTYDPTTTRPPFLLSSSLVSPFLLSLLPLLLLLRMTLALSIGFLGNPIRACTNDAADLTNNRFPSFSSASNKPSANTCASRNVTALTMHGRMPLSFDSLDRTASGPPRRTSSMVMLSTVSRGYRPRVFSSTYSERFDFVNPNAASLANGVSAAGISSVPSAT
mmetsp:Transcript_34642/g.74921  ORF Transcript_34642/g.74921 Transcript_34642/m.74921 type:complete len:281 (-) Transcript_34642:594-1436(-)